MSTSTLADADDSATGFSSLGLRAEQPSDRRIAQFIAGSLVVHALLLWVLRVPGNTDSISILPDLFVELEIEDGRDSERERPPPAAQSTQTSAPASEPLLASEEGRRAADSPSIPAASESSFAPPEDGSTQDSPPPVESLPGQAAASTEETILTTTGPSATQALVTAEAPAREADYMPIPSTQQGILTRKVMQGIQTLQSTPEPQVRLSWQEGDRTYVAMMTRQPATDGMDIDRATVEIETEEHGERLRTKLNMKRLSFSHFTQLVDRWDTEVQLHDDVVSGRFHSNSEIIVGYDRKIAPLFLGKVTTAARGFGLADNVGRRRREEIFPQGLETRAERIRFPDKVLGAVDQHTRNADVHVFPDDTHITFHSEGSFGWVKVGSNVRTDRPINAELPTYILGAANRTLHVSGIVRGKVLVYSPERIVIEGDLTYARNPRIGSDDYLGLVSDKDVEVAGPRVTGPGDLDIHGAVYAKRRFLVEDIETRRAGTLTIYGSLTAGTISATEPRYATTVEFDPRFERVRPPGFPLTNKYEIETWDQRWEAAER